MTQQQRFEALLPLLSPIQQPRDDNEKLRMFIAYCEGIQSGLRQAIEINSARFDDS